MKANRPVSCSRVFQFPGRHGSQRSHTEATGLAAPRSRNRVHDGSENRLCLQQYLLRCGRDVGVGLALVRQQGQGSEWPDEVSVVVEELRVSVTY